jgi:RNA polymerase sigma-70 factor (ECF subfamily)
MPDERGPPNDLTEQLEALHPASFGWAVACCRGDRLLAEEVLQVSYVKVLDGSARYEGRSSVRTWFFGVIRTTAAELRRRAWTGPALLERWWQRRPEPARARGPEAAASESEAAGLLRQALAGLSTRQREVVHLTFYEDLTLEQAAEVLALPVGTVRVHYERAKRRLRKLLPQDVRP